MCLQSFLLNGTSKQSSLLFLCLFSIFTCPDFIPSASCAWDKETSSLRNGWFCRSWIYKQQLVKKKRLFLPLGSGHLFQQISFFIYHGGLEARIHPHSDLALKHAITCLNTPRTIECDYPKVKSKSFL